MISEAPEWSGGKRPVTGSKFTKWFKKLFRYADYPFLLAVRGFGNRDKLLIQGYLFKGMALDRPSRKGRSLKNLISLIKMFMVRTVAGGKVQLSVNGQYFQTQSDDEGYYSFEISDHRLKEGWHGVEIQLVDQLVENQEAVRVKAGVLISDDAGLAVVSDIDDTLLVSHITRKLRKFYLLTTRNHRSRKPFKGAVDFYKKLTEGTGAERPFFYVSSSEWNLYEFLIRFMEYHEIPKGVLLLKRLKQNLREVISSGYGDHSHKADKIETLISYYPGTQFILLGDNGQHDPQIYRDITLKYHGRISAIYIRNVKAKNAESVEELLENLPTDTLQFKSSEEAAKHARQKGFIR